MPDRETYTDRWMLRWIFAIVLAWVGFGFMVGYMWPVRSFGALMVLGLVAVIFVKFTDFAGDRLSRYIDGAKGEFKVWALLNDMYTQGFRTINNLELSDKGDIDHVVVGPNGVWAIESKFIDGHIEYSNGVLTRDGKPFRKDYVNQALAEARAVREYLRSKGYEVPVRPVLVFSRSTSKVRFGDTPVRGVFVIGTAYLRKIIADERYGRLLPSHQIEEIHALLDEAEA